MVAFNQDGRKVFPVPLASQIFECENRVVRFDGKVKMVNLKNVKVKN